MLFLSDNSLRINCIIQLVLLGNALSLPIHSCIFSTAVTTIRFRLATPGGVRVYNGKKAG
jgi:hypothetical protein